MKKAAAISELISGFEARRILVVGDLMLDRYVGGTVARLSPEAPVPVVLVNREHARPGGAANVAANIRSLGGRATMAGLVGDDAAGRELTHILAAQGIDPAAVVTDAARRTTVKMRILADRQQVVRVDYEQSEPPAPALIARLCARLAEVVPQMDGVIVEDYGKGVVCQPVIDAVLRAAKKKAILVGLDPKDNRELTFSSLSLATPNFMEACLTAGLPYRPLGDDPLRNPLLIQAGDILTQKWKCTLLIITLGSHGMYLISRGKRPLHIPTVAREVFDVSGAGDTVIATAMLALAAGASHELAARVANTAAGVVVAKVGTATCSAAELRANWKAVGAGGGALSAHPATAPRRPRAVGVIPARYGSTRLPGKSLLPICGKPLVVWVVERARQCAALDRVIVATDDPRIADAVRAIGAEAVMTRPDHPSGTDRVAEAVAELDAEIVVNVQGDEPLIDPALIGQLVEALAGDASLDMATAATPIRDEAMRQNPAVVKVVCDAQGRALYFSRATIPFVRDPDKVDVTGLHWRHLGLYAYRRAFLARLVQTPPCATERAESLEQLRALHLGARMQVVQTEDRGIGVDTPADVPYVERVIRELGLA